MVGRFLKLKKRGKCMAMKLSTGKVAFPIEFDNGDKETIFFNPNDPNLFVRLKDFEGNVNKRLKGFNDVDLLPDGTPKDNSIEIIENFEKMQAVVCEELDKAFGGDISAKVFKHCSPFALIDGDYFIILFVEAIKPEIEAHIRKSTGIAEAKMKQHIGKYQK